MSIKLMLVAALFGFAASAYAENAAPAASAEKPAITQKADKKLVKKSAKRGKKAEKKAEKKAAVAPVVPAAAAPAAPTK